MSVDSFECVSHGTSCLRCGSKVEQEIDILKRRVSAYRGMVIHFLLHDFGHDIDGAGECADQEAERIIREQKGFTV